MAKINNLDSALEHVKSAHATIKGEIEQIDQAITQLESENASLPKLQASIEEIKQGVLELIDKSGERYAQEKIKAAVIDFGIGNMSSYRLGRVFGQPLTLGELDGAINGTVWPEARAQFITQMNSGAFDDLGLYAVCADAVKATLAKVMETITPADFGFGTITKDKIGPTRAEMHMRIARNNQEIERLKERKSFLKDELNKFGFK